ncbi:hypothetical protein [Streptomyces sp. CBMA29]|uniref:hypothetical protein n=1 Tax=Streptomyces sp. CBMA29 TaxID=1896314 RepID=UPI001661CBCA|nr:hypothetical protein [Streptomyces sp. CBMA29]MBD0739288.1 hypothetical protein [Streptomyces sp. CBMA29]
MPHDRDRDQSRDPRLHFSTRPQAAPAPAPAAPDDGTFRLSDLGFGGASAGGGFGATDGTGEPDGATVLDPGSWSSEVPGTEPFAPGLRRFGPGVPEGPEPSVGTERTAAVWHGTVRPGEEPVLPPEQPRRKGALGGWLLALLVLLGVVAYLLWQHWPGSVKVEGVSVRNDTAVQGCHSTAKVVGTLRTSGDAGTVRYRWRRSDGTLSDELRQRVAKGRRSTDVVLLWSFDGRGTLQATATLEVLSPQRQSGSYTFTYRCS